MNNGTGRLFPHSNNLWVEGFPSADRVANAGQIVGGQVVLRKQTVHGGGSAKGRHTQLGN